METVTSNIKITKTQASRINEVDFNNIPFGRIFSDHMLVVDYDNGTWKEPEIMPWQKIEVFPCITSLHYGQSIFEGMKAFKQDNGDAVLFRPDDNWERMNHSAWRLCMPEIPKEIFVGGLKELVNLDQQWIPNVQGSALYIRPFMFATDEYVGIKPSDNYKFIIFTCPVGAYYPEPVGLWVSEKFVRAAEGGTGSAKAAGNYAGSLLGQKRAKEKGYHNVLWLDAVDRKYVEECGTMNLFFVIDGKLVTPELTGTILNGITRDSVLTIAEELGIPTEVRRIAIGEIAEAYKQGKLDETFGTGTAAVISHVAKIGYQDLEMVLPAIEDRKVGPAILNRLNDIRMGRTEDKHGWVEKI